MEIVHVASDVDGTTDHIFEPIFMGDSLGVYWVWSTSSGALAGTVDVYLSPDGATWAFSHEENAQQGSNVGYGIETFAGYAQLRWRANSGGGTFSIVASVNQGINYDR